MPKKAKTTATRVQVEGRENAELERDMLAATHELARGIHEVDALDDAVLRVSADDQRALVQTLADPPQPTAALRRALKESAKLIG